MKSADESWTSCPAGEVDALSRRLRSQTRMQTARRYGVRAAAMVVVGVTLFLIARNPGGPESGQKIGGVWCSDVMELAEDYVAGKLDAAVMAQVTAHIDDCPHCREKINELRSGSESPPPAETRDGQTAGSGVAGVAQRSDSWAVALQ